MCWECNVFWKADLLKITYLYFTHSQPPGQQGSKGRGCNHSTSHVATPDLTPSPSFTAVTPGGPTRSLHADSWHLPGPRVSTCSRGPNFELLTWQHQTISSSVKAREAILLQPRGGGTSKSLMGFNRPWNCWQEERHFYMADWTVILAQTGTFPNCDVLTRAAMPSFFFVLSNKTTAQTQVVEVLPLFPCSCRILSFSLFFTHPAPEIIWLSATEVTIPSTYIPFFSLYYWFSTGLSGCLYWLTEAKVVPASPKERDWTTATSIPSSLHNIFHVHRRAVATPM